eukprot:CAMPEP_0116892686 /NCGR_PEP_ID=MMETSP0467-20121206/2851_1 /TAXON_ID=283647 /ORGANISM="Mesodinium pulex, Strain SPMC105" /LENGTH=57 /DNA_ID=CAMNT_0004561947 /DNA_START=2693 /DNA_END=2866 /DNA_ORIENTATION=-
MADFTGEKRNGIQSMSSKEQQMAYTVSSTLDDLCPHEVHQNKTAASPGQFIQKLMTV